MFRKLFQPKNPYRGFLGKIWDIWMRRDVALAVLLARCSWHKLPAELIGQAADLERQAYAARRRGEIDQQVALQLGSLGISPGFSGGGFLGFNQDQAMFIGVMAKIRQHSGNPPFGSQDVVAVAELVLTGQRAPYEALMIGLEKLLVDASYAQAAFALPRERIIQLLPEPHRLQALHDLIQSMRLNETDLAKWRAVFLWCVSEQIEKGALANFGMTKAQIVQNVPYDDVVRRLFELGWLTADS
jgi:hypothetical protein